MAVFSLCKVWFIDGTVKCFREEHVPLALFAVCILAFCVLLIGFFLIAGLRPRLLEVCFDLCYCYHIGAKFHGAYIL